jgi:hypothetical protein
VVESVVQEKFGPLGLRIFRLLIMKKQLEQKQVGDMAMVPLKVGEWDLEIGVGESKLPATT